ncbi:hypothetical protein, partial [Streptomyces noursei]|uniref:hypothetical protein n=1 Tax=Streptomyces noursei TaxID=1971 RepID=UPI0035DB9FEE
YTFSVTCSRRANSTAARYSVPFPGRQDGAVEHSGGAFAPVGRAGAGASVKRVSCAPIARVTS